MCRIFGHWGAKDVTLSMMMRASQLQLEGGPDSTKLLAGSNWWLGANRLSIQGGDNGTQPYNLNNEIHVLFNGEIYNHQEIKDTVIGRDAYTGGDCDGEIIAYLYVRYGLDMTKYLSGMYSFVILDTRVSERIVLCVDHLAIKGLYYHLYKNSIRFSSEIGGLRALLRDDVMQRVGVVDEYFRTQCLTGDETAYEGIRRLNPNEILVLDASGAGSYTASEYDPVFKGNNYNSLDSAGSALNELLSHEVKTMTDTELPVAVQLSGGLDSSLIATLARLSHSDVKAFHVVYDTEWSEDELHFAKQSAAFAGIELEVVEIDVSSIPDYLPSMVKALGLPNAAPHAFSAYMLYRSMHSEGFRICLNGEGADEVFGGYRRHSRALYNQSENWQSEYLSRIAIANESMYCGLYTDRFKNYLVDNKPSPHEQYRKTLYSDVLSRLDRILQFDLAEKLPNFNLCRLDHLSMAHSLEVRVPYCQQEVVAFARRLPEVFKIKDDSRKRVLYSAASGYVPETVLKRNKQPFTMPYGSMLTGSSELRAYTQNTLLDGTLVKTEVLKESALVTLLSEFFEKPSLDAEKLIWSFLVLEAWLGLRDEQHGVCMQSGSYSDGCISRVGDRSRC